MNIVVIGGGGLIGARLVAPIQPVAAEEVAITLAALAEEAALNATLEIGGPECMPMYELIRYYLNETEDARQLVDDEHALYFGAVLSPGALIPGSDAIKGRIRYENWFHQQLAVQLRK